MADSQIQVEVCIQDQFIDSGPNLSAASILEETWQHFFQIWLEILQPQLSPINAYELTLRLTDDRGIQALNKLYRHQDQPTNVLAFAALEVDSPPGSQILDPVYLGDIVISVDTACRQAQQSLSQELAWLAAHGLLHLLGWDHPDQARLTQMLQQQDRLLEAIELNPQSRILL